MEALDPGRPLGFLDHRIVCGNSVLGATLRSSRTAYRHRRSPPSDSSTSASRSRCTRRCSKPHHAAPSRGMRGAGAPVLAGVYGPHAAPDERAARPRARSRKAGRRARPTAPPSPRGRQKIRRARSPGCRSALSTRAGRDTYARRLSAAASLIGEQHAAPLGPRLHPAHGRRSCPGDGWRSGSRVGRSECCLDRGRGPVSIGSMNSLWPSRRIVATAATVPLAALAIAACGAGSDTPRPPKTASGRPATIGLEPAGSLGKVLVDSRGRTVYLFRKDSRGKSACAAACAAAWPPVRAQGMPVPGPGLTAAKLTTTTRSDGAPQVLYGGHPLYRYAGDAKPGDTNGQRLTDFGAAWFAVSGAGQVVSRPASRPGGKSGY